MVICRLKKSCIYEHIIYYLLSTFDCRRYTSQARQTCLAFLLNVFLFWVVVKYRSILTDFLICALSLRSLYERKRGLAALLPTTHPICMRSPRQVAAAPLPLLDSDCLSNHSTENVVLLKQDQNELHLQKDMRNFMQLRSLLGLFRFILISGHADHITCFVQKKN